MNTSKRTDNHKTDWQTIGELELSVDIGTDDAIRVWLAESLNALNLSTEFFKRFLKSVQVSVTRAFETNGSVPLVYVHISILVPNKHNSEGKSWGFFHIERIETKPDNINEHNHAIDFYLYVEGK